MKEIKIPNHIKGLIFDCDGTLVDSMPLHMKSWEHVIMAAGGPWDYEFFFSRKGMPEQEIVNLYNRRFGLALDPVETVSSKHEHFLSSAGDLRPVGHVVEIARQYHRVLPMAVVSGGTRRIVGFELESLQLKDLFPVILTADDGLKPKPAPDLFLEAAKRLGAPPEACQVFEDGDLGLNAARKAGMLATDIR